VVEAIDETSSRLLIGADEMGWLDRYLLGLSMRFDVEDPPELRAELAAIGDDLARRFAD
jgi:hypothetical protein